MVHMSMPSEVLREALEAALKRERVGQREWERRHHLPAWSIRGLLDERRQCPSLDRAAVIARELGLRFDFDVDPDGEVSANPASETQIAMPKSCQDALAALFQEIFNAGFDMSPWKNQQRGERHVLGDLWFRHTWLVDQGLDERFVWIMEVGNDEMEPALPKGCMILVDHRPEALQRRDGGIYVIEFGDDRETVRRLREEDGRWVMRADNPDHEPTEMPDEGRIVGEVKLSTRKHGGGFEAVAE